MFVAMRHGEFRKYFYSMLWQSSGYAMQFLILGWLVLDLTDSGSQLGLVIFLYGLPNLILMPLAGIAADRLDRRQFLIISQTVVTLVIVLLATLTITNSVTMWHVYIVATILGAIQGFLMPAGMAIVADLVERDDILNANSLNSAVFNGTRILAPSVAGVIVEFAGIGEALYVNAACSGLTVVHLWTMQKVRSHDSAAEANVLGNLMDGLKFTARTPVVFSIVGMGFAFGLFGAAYLQILPAFAKDVLSLDAAGAGLLLSASGAGSLVGNLALAALGNSRHKNWLLLGTITLFGASLLLLAWSTWYLVSLAIMFFVGMGFAGFISVMTTVLQLSTPPAMRGRVMSLMLISAALHYLGALPLSILADLYSWPISITAGSLLMLAVVVWLGALSPTIRHMRVD
jgi:predicted MFS family arabinose efflux permease